MGLSAMDRQVLIDLLHDDLEELARPDGEEAVEICKQWRQSDHLEDIRRRDLFYRSRLSRKRPF